MSKYISQRQFTLLSSSNIYEEVLKENPWLGNFLLTNKDLSKEEVEDLPEEYKNFFKNSFFTIIKQAEGEWKSDKIAAEDLGDNKDEWVKCSLCGTRNRYVYYIVNQINGIPINVGSDCVKEFNDILKRNGFDIKQLKKDAKRTRRLLEINKNMPGINKIIDEWSMKLGEYPIIIPTKYETPYTSLGDELNKVFESFLNEEIDLNNSILELRKLMEKRSELLNDINKYVDENKAKKFIVNHDIERWVISHNDREAIKNIKEDGEIRYRTAHRITETSFMNSMVKEIKPIFNSLNIQVEKADSTQRGYIINCKPYKNIKLLCDHKELFLKFGDHVFESNPESKIDKESIFRISKIVGRDSIELCMEEIAGKLDKSNVPVLEYDSIYDTVTFFERQSKSYVMLKLRTFVNKFKEIAYEINTLTLSNVAEYVKNSNERRYLKEEYDDIIRLRYRNKEEYDDIISERRKITY